MSVPFVDLKLQYKNLRDELMPLVDEVFSNAQFILGPKVEAFEKAFATYCGTKHAIAVNSGTAALQLLLRAHGIKPGDEVILPANTFFATAEAVLLEGAVPVLVDCEPEAGLIDVAALEKAITPKTKAILPVHLFGQPVDLDEILAIARSRKILVIEDACQAHGALYKGKRVGGLADGGAFSFYPGKNLGAYGEGGAVTTNDDDIAATIRMLREHGMPRRYVHEVVGWNERMDGVQGAVLGVKLPKLDSWNDSRRMHAKAYREKLTGVGDLTFFAEKPERQGVYHLFVVQTARRDELQTFLNGKGIQTGIHYPIPVHLQEAVASLGHKEGDFPVSEKLAKTMLSLPMFGELTDAQVDEVCAAVRGFYA